MTTQHTPGPWMAYAETVKIDRKPVCNRIAVFAMDEDGPVGHIEFSEGNALVIAAAPDLLEACKAMLEEYGGTDRVCGDMAKAAIAKATGAP